LVVEPTEASEEFRAPVPYEITFYGWMVKRVFDCVLGVIVIPSVMVVALGLIIVNPFLNPGPLFEFRRCMGRYGEEFNMVSFRSRLICDDARDARLAAWRDSGHTRLGGLLYRSRLESFPNVFNILRGEMSFIGPRPDPYNLARLYRAVVPGYGVRLAVRPGVIVPEYNFDGLTSLEVLRERADADVNYVLMLSVFEDARIFRSAFVRRTRGTGSQADLLWRPKTYDC